MRVSVILKNTGGELANETIVVDESHRSHEDFDDLVSDAIKNEIRHWQLNPGDTIEIRELVEDVVRGQLERNDEGAFPIAHVGGRPIY